MTIVKRLTRRVDPSTPLWRTVYPWNSILESRSLCLYRFPVSRWLKAILVAQWHIESFTLKHNLSIVRVAPDAIISRPFNSSWPNGQHSGSRASSRPILFSFSWAHALERLPATDQVEHISFSGYRTRPVMSGSSFWVALRVLELGSWSKAQ